MKILKILEEHIEKIVIGIVLIICLWLLISKVVFTPNTVEYDGKTFGPSEIDKYVSKKAEQLEIQIEQPPEPKEDYQPRFDEFRVAFGTPLRNINSQLAFTRTLYLEKNRVVPKYALPEIPPVNDVKVEHIRAVAYVPAKPVTPEQPYTQEICEPNDIDLVTVAGEFDLTELYQRYEKCFAGKDLQESWRNENIAEPVVAGVQLQRQSRTQNGGWSEWKEIRRSKINPLPKNFEIIDEVSQLPAGGVNVRRLQFDNPSVMMQLLQPEPYRIASADEQWLPPELHTKYAKYQQQVQKSERRQKILARRREEQQKRQEAMETRRKRREELESRTPARGGGVPGGLGGGPGGMGPGMTGPGGREQQDSGIAEKLRERRSRELSGANLEDIVTVDIDKVYEQFEELTIDQDFNIEDLNKPVKFWVFDDTVETDGEYRYRIKIGFFNPVAGTDKLSKEYEEYRDDVILWSDYSEATKTVEIPKTLYFFARQAQDERNRATVQVFKYAMGYWYSKDFTVEAGEIIGGVAAPRQKESTEAKQGTEEGKSVIPDTINFSTNAVMVDVFGPLKEWSGASTLRQKYYYDIIYTYEGEDFEHMPVRASFWGEKLRTKFYELRRLADQPRKPLKSWSESSQFKRERRRVPGPEREGFPPGMVPPMEPGMGPPGGAYPGYRR